MTTPIRAPHWMLLTSEPVRAAIEYLEMRAIDIATLPRGDGHPVVVFPGLAANEMSTGPLVQLCRRLGYAAHDWGRGLNTGPRGDVATWLDELARHVGALAAAHPRTMSLIGWSLGGFYAREVAKRLRRRVRGVRPPERNQPSGSLSASSYSTNTSVCSTVAGALQRQAIPAASQLA